MFDGVIGHEKILEVLSRVAEHPGQAYLFSGAEGMGKKMVAEKFAGEVLGEGSLDSHPDFIRVQREEGARDISIKQARVLIERLSLSSARGGRTVVLIEDADALNEESSNALLKIVEEPPGHLIFLFLSERPDRLPITLRSRLAPLVFYPVASSVIESWLLARGVKKEEALFCATSCGGSPGLALRMSQDVDVWKERARAAKNLVSVMCEGTVGNRLAVIEKFTQAVELNEHAVAAWREELTLAMRQYSSFFLEDPSHATHAGEALTFAFRQVGGSLSPRFALEWWGTRDAFVALRSIPLFLSPAYL